MNIKKAVKPLVVFIIVVLLVDFAIAEERTLSREQRKQLEISQTSPEVAKSKSTFSDYLTSIKKRQGLFFRVYYFLLSFPFRLIFTIIVFFFCVRSLILHKKRGHRFHYMYFWCWVFVLIPSLLYLLYVKNSWSPRDPQALAINFLTTLSVIIAILFLIHAEKLKRSLRERRNKKIGAGVNKVSNLYH